MGENIITSLLMRIIELCYNRRTLKLNMKDRERPRIVELLRFCIIPLKKYLESQLGRAEFKEFNMKKLFDMAWDPQKPDPTLLCMEFDTLLKKLQKKNDWDEKVTRYNELSKEWSKNMNDLKQKLKELLDNNLLLLRDYYEKSGAEKSYSFDTFKNDLIDRFFYCYEVKKQGSGLLGAWYYVGNKMFDNFEANLSSILIGIDRLIEKKDALLRDLIDLLEDVRKRLREDYHISLLEETPLIELSSSAGWVF